MILSAVFYAAIVIGHGAEGRAPTIIVEGDAGSGARYYSLGMLEPDKLASAWLIHRHIVPGATILLMPKDSTPPKDAIPFDLPDARWSRRPTQSTFERILEIESTDDDVLKTIAGYIRAGEISYWLLSPDSVAGRFDAKVRECALQDDVKSAFAYLDSVYQTGGELPE